MKVPISQTSLIDYSSLSQPCCRRMSGGSRPSMLGRSGVLHPHQIAPAPRTAAAAITGSLVSPRTRAFENAASPSSIVRANSVVPNARRSRAPVFVSQSRRAVALYKFCARSAPPATVTTNASWSGTTVFVSRCLKSCRCTYDMARWRWGIT